MIEKLDIYNGYKIVDWLHTIDGRCGAIEVNNKINEIIDYINHSNHEYESIDDVVEDFVNVNETAHKFRSTNERLRNELDRTRKALDKAKWWLHEIVESHRYTPISTAEMALKEITELEQKDNGGNK